jgi:hypothetical protein
MREDDDPGNRDRETPIPEKRLQGIGRLIELAGRASALLIPNRNA